MSESTAPPQQVNTLEEIEAAMVEMEEGFIRLYQRYVELNGKGVEDKQRLLTPFETEDFSESFLPMGTQSRM